MKKVIFCIAAASMASFAQNARSESRLLTVDEAQGLVLVEIHSDYRHAIDLPGFEIDHYKDPYLPGFMVFSVFWRGMPDGGMVIDNFDVNMRNSDLWEASSCEEFKGPRVRRAQGVLRRKMNLSDEAYHQYRGTGPFC